MRDWEDPFEGWSKEKYEKFLDYHKSHLWIWKAFEAMALSFIKEGGRRWSSDNILHVIRWNHRSSDGGTIGDDFKINNDYSAGFARAWGRKYPQYSYLFEKRTCNADRNSYSTNNDNNNANI